jgi:hypothetical protein
MATLTTRVQHFFFASSSLFCFIAASTTSFIFHWRATTCAIVTADNNGQVGFGVYRTAKSVVL